MRLTHGICAAAALALTGFTSLAFADGRDWNDGPVVNVASIRTVDGHFDEYMHWLATTYKVRLASGSSVVLRLGEPLPPALQQLAGDLPWGFLTAWNPQSRRQSLADNRQEQRRLLVNLRASHDITIHPALGVGTDAWCEPSFWLVNITHQELARLGKAFGQAGWLYGQGSTRPVSLALATEW